MANTQNLVGFFLVVILSASMFNTNILVSGMLKFYCSYFFLVRHDGLKTIIEELTNIVYVLCGFV